MSASSVRHLTVAERAERGKHARARVPRERHAEWEPAPSRSNPVSWLEEQALTRVPSLVPIRHGRMLASPFAFFRGGALLMASDLATTPVSGLTVQACGDAHVANFGLYGSPERKLVFDLNDFDETHPAPWEWDVKRMLASVAIAGPSEGVLRIRASICDSRRRQHVSTRDARPVDAGVPGCLVPAGRGREGSAAHGVDARQGESQATHQGRREGAHQGQSSGPQATDPHGRRR